MHTSIWAICDSVIFLKRTIWNMTSKALKTMVNSPTVQGKATARTAGMHDIGGVPKVDLRDNAMPKDIMVTPRISKMYLIINFLSILISILKPFLST